MRLIGGLGIAFGGAFIKAIAAQVMTVTSVTYRVSRKVDNWATIQ